MLRRRVPFQEDRGMACWSVIAAAATGRHRLWSTVRPWNAASVRVLEKIGFRRDHIATDDQGDVFLPGPRPPSRGPVRRRDIHRKLLAPPTARSPEVRAWRMRPAAGCRTGRS